MEKIEIVTDKILRDLSREYIDWMKLILSDREEFIKKFEFFLSSKVFSD